MTREEADDIINKLFAKRKLPERRRTLKIKQRKFKPVITLRVHLKDSKVKTTQKNVKGYVSVSRASSSENLGLTPLGVDIQFFREFDPGSGRTLAACLTHASRTEISELALIS